MAALGVQWGQLPPAVAGITPGNMALGTEIRMRFNTALPEDHSRILIGHVDGDEYVCLTPDNDMWVETILAGGADVLLVGMRPADLILP